MIAIQCLDACSSGDSVAVVVIGCPVASGQANLGEGVEFASSGVVFGFVPVRVVEVTPVVLFDFSRFRAGNRTR